MKNAFAVVAAIALLCLGVAAQADVFNMGPGLTSLEMVTVGDPGNEGELSGEGAGGYGPDRICGSVGYNYNIGKYEVTAGQYTDFLNNKAKIDTYGLYSTQMDTVNDSYGCNIKRSGGGTVANPYVYTVADDWANRPVNFVSFGDSCRFANWLGNGQGDGDTETGAYTLTADGIANNTITRNADWKWAVTSEDEWYKAAYYKGGSTSAGYWLYPTSSAEAPGRDIADASGNNANIYQGSGAYPIDSGKYTTVAGEFQNSASPYGTFDQGGNVWERNDVIMGTTFRGLRGGSFFNNDYYLQASYRNYYCYVYPYYENSDIGFRVSEVVPEPSSLITLALGSLGTLLVRRRLRG